MALVLKNRVQETATANTTVSFTLTGASMGFQSFSSIGDTNTTYYTATDITGNWEVGIGTYSTSGPTLTRTTILASSNSGNAVTFSGTVDVFVTYPSEKSINLDASGNASALGTIASGTWNGTAIGVAYGGTGATTDSGARTNLGATTVGSNLFTLTNPSAITFPRFNADNTVSALAATDYRTAIGAGTGDGTVTSVGGTGTVNGITLTGTVTSIGNLTLGGTLSGIGNAQLTNSSVTVNGTAIALGASGTITANTTNALTIGTGLSGTSFNGSAAVTIAIDSTVATLSGSQTLTNKTLTDPAITGTILEDIFALTDGATVDIDPANGSIQTLTLTSTGRTLTFTNMVDGEAITLMVNDGTAGTITTWNATFVNNGATAPTLSTTGFTVVSIWKVAGTVYAAVVGNA